MDREKERLRKKFLAIRKGLSWQSRRQAHKSICHAALELPELKMSQIVCIFFSLPGEVDIRELITKLFQLGKTVVLPKVVANGLEVREITSIGDTVVGPYRVLEPDEGCPRMPKQSVDLFMIPGLCFDRNGFRIGWGKGYYDRLLEGVSAPKIGIAYEAQMVARVPHTSYDVPMDRVITEKHTYARTS